MDQNEALQPFKIYSFAILDGYATSLHYFYWCIPPSSSRPSLARFFFSRWSRCPMFYKLVTGLSGAAHTAFYADALARAGKAPSVLSVDRTRECF